MMISVSIIGFPRDIKLIQSLLDESKLFGNQFVFPIDDESGFFSDPEMDFTTDAVFLVSPVQNCFSILKQQIRAIVPIFSVDQPALTIAEIDILSELNNEADNLFFLHVDSLYLAVFEEFILEKHHELLFKYTRAVNDNIDFREAMISALGFLFSFSSLPPKIRDIKRIVSNSGKLIHLKMSQLDGSLSEIILSNFESLFLIEISDNQSHLNFDLSQGTLKNLNGATFSIERYQRNQSLKASLNRFAFYVIQGKKPVISFYDYALMVKFLELNKPI